jgi:diketogulonate reductase-like aldo/keto reductase
MYGNHEAIGKVFGKVFAEGGSLKREDVWVTSKVTMRTTYHRLPST